MSDIIVETKNGIGKIIFNRPDTRNAITRNMWDELLEIVQKLRDDDKIKCVVITGTGDAFSAGGDIKDMMQRLKEKDQKSPEEQEQFIRCVVESAQILHEMPKPTIAAINGAAAGAGLSLALACDIRVMVKDAKLITAFINVALSGDFGGAWFLSKLVGPAKAREMFFMPEPITGSQAEKIGIVNFATPKNEFDKKVEEIATRLANAPTKTLGFMKQNFLTAQNTPLDEYLDQEAKFMGLSFALEDHREAAQAFLEKRKPNFKGK